jgi:hypothetical protein
MAYTDAQLIAAKKFGPSLIGQELYDAAQAFSVRTGDGKFGPALLDPGTTGEEHHLPERLAPLPPQTEPGPGITGNVFDVLPTEGITTSAVPTFDEMNKSEIRDLLRSHAVPIPERPTRQQLIALCVESKIAPIFPPALSVGRDEDDT